ncbi:hypothetical protein [Mailhella massiliensis]|uniref:hypothetical protein n=1 Tax=Mailhella massiliensis TaxID=1903261 RepID=UPI00097D903B|nr:hypothetical protein [Mailhella massiliensis]
MRIRFAFCLALACLLLPAVPSGATPVPSVTGRAEQYSPAGADWEKSYVDAARITIEKGVMSVMNGISSPEQLRDSVDYFCRTWDNWADSQLFILQDDRDIDVYGNLYSLQVMCRTLHLAATDWHELENSARSAATLEKALELENRSRLLAEPVAEIITRQSYSAYLPRRVEIMKEQLPYVDEYYERNSFRSVMEARR